MGWAIIRGVITYHSQSGIEKRLRLLTEHWSLKTQLVASGVFALLCTGVWEGVIWGGFSLLTEFLVCYAFTVTGNHCEAWDLMDFGATWVTVLILVPILVTVSMLFVFSRLYRSDSALIVEKFYLMGIIMLWLGWQFLVISALGIGVGLWMRFF